MTVFGVVADVLLFRPMAKERLVCFFKGHDDGWPPDWDAEQRRLGIELELRTQLVCRRCGRSWVESLKRLTRHA